MQQGFSTIETLLALALSAIVLVSAIHIGRNWYDRYLLSQHLSIWMQSLRFARTYALVVGRTTTICPSDDALTCAAHNRYESGWLIFAESAPAPLGQLDPSDQRIAAAAAWPESLTLRTNFDEPIRFNVVGRASGNGRFVVCLDNDPARAAGIFLIRSGRLRLAAADEIDRCLLS